MLKILLQILIITIWIFSNDYQSLVTSFMLNPQEEPLLKSFDDLFDSDYRIQSSLYAAQYYSENPKYQRKISRFNHQYSFEHWLAEMKKWQFADAQLCYIWKDVINFLGDGKSYEGIYQIPEVAYSFREALLVLDYHPYVDKFQDLMDRSLEAGLIRAWKNFYDLINLRYLDPNIPEPENEEKEILEFKDIIPFFLILAVGFYAALVALFGEIFYHDFVAQLSKKYFKRKFDEIFMRKKRKISKVRSKIIEVKPAME